MPHAAFLALSDPQTVNGCPVALPTRTVPDISPEVAGALLHAGHTKSSPVSAVFLHHLHGAAARVPAQATAFGLQEEHFMVEIVATWDDGDDVTHRAWAD